MKYWESIDNAKAEKHGWGIYLVDGELQLTKTKNQDRFKDDTNVWLHVWNHCGSDLCGKALLHIQHNSRFEYRRIYRVCKLGKFGVGTSIFDKGKPKKHQKAKA